MLQPKFNPFFYAKFVFAYAEYSENSQENQELDELQKHGFEKRRAELINLAKLRIGYANPFEYSRRKDALIKDIDTKTEKGLKDYFNSSQLKHIESIEGKKESINSKLNDMSMLIDETVNEFIKNEAKRIDFIKTLEDEKEKVVNHMVDFFENDENIDENDKKKIGKEALIMVTKALMNDVIVKNKATIEAMTDKQIKMFDPKRFENILKTDIYDDKNSVVNTIKNKIVLAWVQDKPRDIYKNKNWTENNMPDGSIGKKIQYSPMLEEELKKDTNAASGQEKMFAIGEILNERKRLIHDFKEIGGTKDDLEAYQKEINKVATECELVDANNNYPVEWILGNWKASQLDPKYINIMHKEVEILNDAIAKLQSELTSKPQEPEIIPEDKKTKIENITIDKDGVHIIGENLDAVNKKNDKIQIDLGNQPPMQIASSKSGEMDVSFVSGAEDIKKQIIELVKSGVSKKLASQFKGVDFNKALSAVKDEDINEATKKHFENFIPNMEVYGLASPEGGFKQNMFIAEKRGKEAKNKILAKVPKEMRKDVEAKITVKYGIQGPNGIINKEDELFALNKDLIAKWNEEVAENDESKIKDEKVEVIYNKVGNVSSATDKEKAFIDKYFTKVRGAAVKVDLPDDKKNIEIAMNFENKPATQPVQPSSPGGETQVASTER